MYHRLQLTLDNKLCALPFAFLSNPAKRTDLDLEHRLMAIRWFAATALEHNLQPATFALAAKLLDAHGARGGDITCTKGDVLMAAIMDVAMKVCPDEEDDALPLARLLQSCSMCVNSRNVWNMQGHIIAVQKGSLIQPTVFSFIGQLVMDNHGKFTMREIFGAFLLGVKCILTRTELKTSDLALALFCVRAACSVEEGWVPDWVPSDETVRNFPAAWAPICPVFDEESVGSFTAWLQTKITEGFAVHARPEGVAGKKRKCQL